MNFELPKRLFLFMPSLNQTEENLRGKTEDIIRLHRCLRDERDMRLSIHVTCDGSGPEFNTPNTLEWMRERLVPEGVEFSFSLNEERLGKTVTVVDGLKRLMANAGPNDLIGCLDDNEHRFSSSLDLVSAILDQGYLGSIGTIVYPPDYLNSIDRHAMPAVGGIESQVLGLNGTLYIYASGYWINRVSVVRTVVEKLFPMYLELFHRVHPNLSVPTWGTPTLFQELMNWVIRNLEPWRSVPEERRRMTVFYLPCFEVPGETPLGRSLEKAQNQIQSLVLNWIVLNELLGVNRDRDIPDV
ncbi:MAG: hypothetical protein HGA31_01800 [Candidatus Moranbacteria bacterium]|nr:hypothetical protein [Candidatus Moranbacteria bacterium]